MQSIQSIISELYFIFFHSNSSKSSMSSVPLNWAAHISGDHGQLVATFIRQHRSSWDYHNHADT
jgi:hypothetical protein